MSNTRHSSTPPHIPGVDSVAHAVRLLRSTWKYCGWHVIATAAIAGLLGGLLAMVLPSRYTTTLSFLGESRSSAKLSGDLASLAGLAGIGDLGSQEGAPYYARLLDSRELRLLVAGADTMGVLRDGVPLSATIGVRIGCDQDLEAERLECDFKTLDKRTSTDVDPRSRVVTLTVTAPTPGTARAIGLAFLSALNRFNTGIRHSRAHNERSFLEQRVQEATAEALRREDELRQFLETNRVTAGAPRLQFEQVRLQRIATENRDIASTLRKQLEQSRLEELRETPSITVVDAPYIPAERSWPKTEVWMVVSAFLGGILGVYWYLIRPAAADARYPPRLETSTHAATVIR